MRAPTPTASAEIATEFYFKAMDRINELHTDLKKALINSFKTQKQKLEFLRSKIRSPLVILREQNQRIDSYELQLKQNIKISINQNKQKLNLLNIRFKEKSPSAYIQELNIKLGNIKNMIQKEIKSCLNRNLIFVQEYEKNLEILNPLSILDRGYSIIQNQSGKSIKSNDDVKIGENLTARLNKGFIDIEVKNKKDAL
jgi:exodeoxyribonuclease VII large subunit